MLAPNDSSLPRPGLGRLALGDPAPSGGPALLTFLRHLGCIFCADRLAEVMRHRLEWQETGSRVDAIAIAEARRAGCFAPSLAPNAMGIAHPNSAAHHVYGVARGVAACFFSGTLLVSGNGAIRFACNARFPYKDPRMHEILHATKAWQIEVNA